MPGKNKTKTKNKSHYRNLSKRKKNTREPQEDTLNGTTFDGDIRDIFNTPRVKETPEPIKNHFISDRLTLKGFLPGNQEDFVFEVLKGVPPTQAAINVGYKPSSASSYASRMMRDPKVIQFLESEKEKILEGRRDEIRDALVERIHVRSFATLKDAFNDDNSPRPINEWPDPLKHSLSSIHTREYPDGSVTHEARLIDSFPYIKIYQEMLGPKEATPLRLKQSTTVNGSTLEEIERDIYTDFSKEELKQLLEEKEEKDSQEPNSSIPLTVTSLKEPIQQTNLIENKEIKVVQEVKKKKSNTTVNNTTELEKIELEKIELEEERLVIVSELASLRKGMKNEV